MNQDDIIKGTILPDGSIKLVTDQISQANHTAAEDLLRNIKRLAGGEETRTRRKEGTGHVHTHTHQHA